MKNVSYLGESPFLIKMKNNTISCSVIFENILYEYRFLEFGDILVRALQVANSIPHANGVRASVLHVRSCVGNRLFASTQLAVMPYPSQKKMRSKRHLFANIESILLSVKEARDRILRSPRFSWGYTLLVTLAKRAWVAPYGARFWWLR